MEERRTTEPTGPTASIVFLCTTLDWGGSEGYAVKLACAYARRGLRTAVIVDSGPLHRLPILERAGVPVQVLGVTAGWTSARYSEVLRSALQGSGAQIIHAQTWERLPEAFTVTDGLGLPLVYTMHTTVTWGIRDRLGLYRNPHRFWGQEKAIRHVNPIVINISDLSERNFRCRYPTVTRSRRVYCGAYLPPEPNDVSLGGDAPHVLWVGSLIPRKRPLWALKAWRGVAAHYPHARMTMVGSGPLLPEVQAAAATFPAGTVTVAGNVPDMRPLLQNAQIMFHTAKQEGIPTNIIYANMFGIPTVSTDVGAISEAVITGRTGLLNGLYDVKGIRRGVCDLIGDPALREQYGRQAHFHGESLFSMDHYVKENLRVYSEFGGVRIDVDAISGGEDPETLN